MDSDDLLGSDALKYLVEASEGYDVVFGMVDSFSDVECSYQRHRYVNEGVNKYRCDQNIYTLAQIMCACNKLIRLSFLRERSVKFSEHRIMEDALFGYLLAFAKPRVNIIDNVILHIRHHSHSLSSYDNVGKIQEVVDVTNELIEYGKRNSLYSRFRLSGNNLVYFLLNNENNSKIFDTIISCKNKIEFRYRILIVAKLLKISKNYKCLKLL